MRCGQKICDSYTEKKDKDEKQNPKNVASQTVFFLILTNFEQTLTLHV